MNWYKKSQQQDFSFFKDIPKQKPVPIQETEDYKSLEKKTVSQIINLLENTTSEAEIIDALKSYRLSWKKVFLGKEEVITFNLLNETYIIDDFEYPSPKEATEWVWRLTDNTMDVYVPDIDSNKSFWNDVFSSSTVYHATQPEYAEEIKKKGLRPSNQTRGISNRGTGSAVFTSENPNDIEPYGDVVFEIHLGDMKKDGYMPIVSREEPIEEAEKRNIIANKIGLDMFDATYDLGSEGIYSSTVVIYGTIPPKYLSLYTP
jgi:hypothetical protein